VVEVVGIPEPPKRPSSRDHSRYAQEDRADHVPAPYKAHERFIGCPRTRAAAEMRPTTNANTSMPRVTITNSTRTEGTGPARSLYHVRTSEPKGRNYPAAVISRIGGKRRNLTTASVSAVAINVARSGSETGPVDGSATLMAARR
jgi:hypothetical protein